MGEYEERASELPCLVGSLLACFLFRPALPHNSGICIRAAALLNVIISIRLISLARSLAPSPIRNTNNTIRPTFPSLYSLTLSHHVLQLGAYFSCYPCGIQDLEFFLSVLSVNEGLSLSE